MLRHILLPALLSLLSVTAAPLSAQEAEDAVARWQEDPTTVFEATEIDLEDFLWIARPVVVFADSPAMPAFQDQMELIADRAEELARRDVVVVTDTDPDAMTDIRRNLRPRGFQLTVIGKDGSVGLRKPFPWDVREITRSIDKMPMRQREIREGS